MTDLDAEDPKAVFELSERLYKEVMFSTDPVATLSALVEEHNQSEAMQVRLRNALNHKSHHQLLPFVCVCYASVSRPEKAPLLVALVRKLLEAGALPYGSGTSALAHVGGYNVEALGLLLDAAGGEFTELQNRFRSHPDFVFDLSPELLQLMREKGVLPLERREEDIPDPDDTGAEPVFEDEREAAAYERNRKRREELIFGDG
uniref:Uncharacterized protein n=1 Tax=Chromera velia CCMP2878 TaxID=1169474 RepID=A0A0G4HPV2_9ALVE|eukprot:Cvel_7843.t1-p1 / transcript=Cvel_7843.t1 / gene=Cvel_7843 / organism=Chromera_velia_CCMP2878 / gene_product=hypothetical protein / transcript_product=hypothetical protein / location=Cvel_scaffold419:60692-61297(-) / protein_length=202 / sequence_SO=supercontig / SO=protein_coding / is_pseudo=false